MVKRVVSQLKTLLGILLPGICLGMAVGLAQLETDPQKIHTADLGEVTMCPGETMTIVPESTYKTNELPDPKLAYEIDTTIKADDPTTAGAEYNKKKQVLKISAGANDSDTEKVTRISILLDGTMDSPYNQNLSPEDEPNPPVEYKRHFTITVRVKPKKECTPEGLPTPKTPALKVGGDQPPKTIKVEYKGYLIKLCVNDVVTITPDQETGVKSYLTGKDLDVHRTKNLTITNSNPAVAGTTVHPAKKGASARLVITGLSLGRTRIHAVQNPMPKNLGYDQILDVDVRLCEEEMGTGEEEVPKESQPKAEPPKTTPAPEKKGDKKSDKHSALPGGMKNLIGPGMGAVSFPDNHGTPNEGHEKVSQDAPPEDGHERAHPGSDHVRDIESFRSAPASPSGDCSAQMTQYREQLYSMASQGWAPPRPPRHGIWATVIQYEVMPDRTVRDVKVKQSSGYAPLDQSAVNRVIQLGGKIAPLPGCFSQPSLPVDHTFRLHYK